MLAQNFQSADELDITEPQKEALIKTLVLLETGKLAHIVVPPSIFTQRSMKFTGHFNMGWWRNEHSCGTVACIGGTAELIGGLEFPEILPNGLYDLFNPTALDDELWEEITPAQAATALRSYLTTGDSKWSEAVS